MIVKICKSGNSATLRIPPDILKELNFAIGEELIMTTSNNMISFEKKSMPRDGWFDNISPIAARNEAEKMEQDFGNPDDFNQLDEWEHGDEW